MTTLQVIIRDDIHEADLAQAGREHNSMDALVSGTLRAAVALPLPGLTPGRPWLLGGFRPHPVSRPRRPARAGG